MVFSKVIGIFDIRKYLNLYTCCIKCDPVPVSDIRTWYVSVWRFLWIIQGVSHKFNDIFDVHIDMWYIQENEVGPIRSLWKKYLIYLVQQSIQYKCTTLCWITKKSSNWKVANIWIKIIKDTRCTSWHIRSDWLLFSRRKFLYLFQ